MGAPRSPGQRRGGPSPFAERRGRFEPLRLDFAVSTTPITPAIVGSGKAQRLFRGVRTPSVRRHKCAVKALLDQYGRGGMRACSGRKPKGVCGSPNRGFSTPRSPGRGAAMNPNVRWLVWLMTALAALPTAATKLVLCFARGDDCAALWRTKLPQPNLPTRIDGIGCGEPRPLARCAIFERTPSSGRLCGFRHGL